MENEIREELKNFLELELQTIGSFDSKVIFPTVQSFRTNEDDGIPTLLTTTIF